MSKTRSRISLGIVIGALIALVPVGAQGATPPPIGVFSYPCSSNSAVGNFRGRGTGIGTAERDLAVGSPGDSLAGKQSIDGTVVQGPASAGSVNVIYPNGVAGLDPTHNAQYFSEGSPGIARATLKPQDGDAFGFAVAAGDFNGDGKDDLAIGAPGKDSQAGMVLVIYGGTNGLVPASSQVIQQGVGGVKGNHQAGAEFGYALAAGDFNGDGVKDLAIGSPRYDETNLRDTGVVNILYGKAGTGLSTTGQQMSDQGTTTAHTPEVQRAEPDDRFGASLAAGQLSDGSSPEDLAVGAPGEDIGSNADDGSVLIWHGTPKTNTSNGGVTATGGVFFYPGGKDMPGPAQSGADFGCSLAVGDFNGDHLKGDGAGADQDLSVGAPGWDIGAATDAGSVFTVYNSGTPVGVTPTDLGVYDPSTNPNGYRAESAWHSPDLWTEDAPGIPGVATKGAHFGASLAAGDFDGNDVVDLAIGEPTQTLYGETGAGTVRVIDGVQGFGLSDSDRHAFAQSPADDQSACYLDNTPIGSGCSFTLNGPADYSPLWMVAEKDDNFGASLAAGDFNGDGKADLSIGTPGEDYGEFLNYITEEKGEIPSTFLSQLGIPVSLSFDEQKEAGIVQVVNGPLPAPTSEPAGQQIIVRLGKDSLSGLGEAVRRSILYKLPAGLFVDDQIPAPTNGDQTWSNDLTGDTFGASQG